MAPGSPYPAGVRRVRGGLRALTLDDGHQLLALAEAQVGQLVELLPVPLLVTSATGEVLRANPTATSLLGSAETLVGRPIKLVLQLADVSVLVRILRHRDEVVRLYVLHGKPAHALPAAEPPLAAR